MSFNLQGIDMLGIKDQVDAAHLNAMRFDLLNAIGVDNFKATTISSSQVRNTCDRVKLWDSSGLTPALAKDVDVTVNLAGSGAGGLDTGSVAADQWYYRWLIGKCAAGDGVATNVAALASLSATAPVMPAGYTHKRLVGPSRTGTGGVLKGLTQRGGKVVYAERQLVVQQTSTVARNTVSLAAFMPPESLIASIKFRSHAPSISGAADGWLWTKGATEIMLGFDADYAEESQSTPWLPAPTRQIDYAWTSISGSNTANLWCIGFLWPINKEP